MAGQSYVFKVEWAKELAPEQYGSQKEKAANTQSLNKDYSMTPSASTINQQPYVATMQKAATTG